MPDIAAERLVVLPARAEVPADDALDRQHLEPLDAQPAPAGLVGHALGGRDEVDRDGLLRGSNTRTGPGPSATFPLSGMRWGARRRRSRCGRRPPVSRSSPARSARGPCRRPAGIARVTGLRLVVAAVGPGAVQAVAGGGWQGRRKGTVAEPRTLPRTPPGADQRPPGSARIGRRDHQSQVVREIRSSSAPSSPTSARSSA